VAGRELPDDRQIIDRLITAGTPNGGSLWPQIEDWMIVSITLGLSLLAYSFWPAKGIAAAVMAEYVRGRGRAAARLDPQAGWHA
jgi:hypothetical protein